ncbi:WecB/TagA/CpsF family glycosyltransferase [Bradyrhizobium sp. ISRA464]|uniref:WecB/TagA/CpsF family glycosyltransferase n=1 Tax=Bradyrhizobium sp. ISRA464 TaxID=2866200 RepID=UPI002479F25A|nr:WecB/TagA/CpsF family glycosyltransferase [Bradyrhizobium sp. ISRA464]WGS31089.1 WecB/TagA/CpsF family glycosyltransferase [Bradyrhizobium sp. ISRA464]
MRALQTQTAAHRRDIQTPIFPDFSRQVVCIEGLLCDAVTFEEAKQRIVSSIRETRRCNLVTPNANFLRLIRSDPDFRDAALATDLSVIDGMPLLWLARLLGIPVRQRVSGSDLFDALWADTSEHLSTFFFGATDDIGYRVRKRLSEAEAAIECAGTLSPGFGSVESMSDPEVLDTINEAHPDLLIVSVGARKGLLWLNRNEHQLSAPVICNLGATINFVAGSIKRAPVFFRRSGIEWLWRIKEEPALWTRYALDLATLISVLLRQVLPWVVYRSVHRPSATQLAAARIRHYQRGDDEILEFFGAWTRQNILPVRDALAAACLARGNLVINVDGVSYVDATFLGQLLLAYGYRRRMHRGFLLGASERRIRKMLRLHGCDYLLFAGQPGSDTVAASEPCDAAGTLGSRKVCERKIASGGTP